MSNDGSKPSNVPADFAKTWRYKLGLSLFILGQVALVAGILLPVLKLAPGGHSGLVGVLIVGGELVSLSSIVFLGKEGFKALKSKIFGFFKKDYAAPVGPVRHYLGIVLLLTNVVTTYTLMAYAWVSFDRATAETPVPAVWGFDFAQQGSLVLWLFLIGELSFLLAIYVLGADWWGRFRDIFVYHKPEEQVG